MYVKPCIFTQKFIMRPRQGEMQTKINSLIYFNCSIVKRLGWFSLKNSLKKVYVNLPNFLHNFCLLKKGGNPYFLAELKLARSKCWIIFYVTADEIFTSKDIEIFWSQTIREGGERKHFPLIVSSDAQKWVKLKDHNKEWQWKDTWRPMATVNPSRPHTIAGRYYGY